MLNQINLHANWNHPSGLFLVLKPTGIARTMMGPSKQEWNRGADFWQFNAYAGLSVLASPGELMVGLLNIADQGYRLDPLNFPHRYALRSDLLDASAHQFLIPGPPSVFQLLNNYAANGSLNVIG